MLQSKDREEYNKEQKIKEPPCYKVIADFPDNKDFPIGKVFILHNWRSSNIYWVYIIKDCKGEREYLSDFFDKYPHLFERVNKPT